MIISIYVMNENKEELEGYVCGKLSIESLALTGKYMAQILGSDARYVFNKGDWSRNPKTGRKIRQYENSYWCKYFADRDGDSFDKSLDDAIQFLKDNDSKIAHLKEQDGDLDIGIELVIKKGDFHIGNVFANAQLRYLAENNIELGLSIYQMISKEKDDFG